MLSSGVCLSVIPSVCPSYAGIVILYRNDCTDLAGCGMDAFSTSVIRKFEYLKKNNGTFLKFCPKLWICVLATLIRGWTAGVNVIHLPCNEFIYTSVDSKATLSRFQHYFDLRWICYTTFSYSCAAVYKISTDIAHRAVHLR